MVRRIGKETRKIILRVIKFCEDEKHGLLVPKEQAIKRACLATGLPENTILEIKKEAKIESVKDNLSISQCDRNIKTESHDEELEHEGGLSHGGDDVRSTYSEVGDRDSCEDIPLTCSPPAEMSTVLVKVEPMEITNEVTKNIESDPGYLVPVKIEPVDDVENGFQPVIANESVVPAHDPLNIDTKNCKRDGVRAKPKTRRKVPSKKKLRPPRDPSHECHICHKKLSAFRKLQAHLVIHTGEKPFKCDVCQCSYPHQKGLDRHSKTHTNKKRFKCSYCDSSFSENNKLQRHIRTHTGEKPFECCYCHNKFNRNDQLQNHLRIHTGEKPYECDTCQSRFTQRYTLLKHLRTHTGEKTHRCSLCHHWFACSASLNIHMRTHTGEKPYQCEKCLERFAQSIHLQRHMKRHLND